MSRRERGHAAWAGARDSEQPGEPARRGLPELIEIVEMPKDIATFTVLPRRWVVERTFAWMGRCRRLAKDFERNEASSLAWARLAACRFLMRRVARELNT